MRSAFALPSIDDALEAEKKRAKAVEKTIETLERKLAVEQTSEAAVKRQEELATATNEEEFHRIELLQEQIKKQETINELAKQKAKDDAELLKKLDQEIEKRQKEEEDKAQKLASVQPGVTATESRLLTRGPAERGIDKIAENTKQSAAELREIRTRLEQNPASSARFELEFAN